MMMTKLMLIHYILIYMHLNLLIILKWMKHVPSKLNKGLSQNFLKKKKGSFSKKKEEKG